MGRFLLRRNKKPQKETCKPARQEALRYKGSLVIIHLLSSLPGEITIRTVALDQKKHSCQLTKIPKSNHMFPKARNTLDRKNEKDNSHALFI